MFGSVGGGVLPFRLVLVVFEFFLFFLLKKTEKKKIFAHFVSFSGDF